MAENKITYITTSEHGMIAGSAPLAPGGRVLYDEENAAHKHLRKLIESEDETVAHLSLVETSPKAEAQQKEEMQEQLAKAAKIAAEAREDELKELQEQQANQEATEEIQPHSDPTDFPPQDEESIRLAKESGAGQRASTQEDVADEDKNDEEKAPRRRSSRSGKD